MNSHKKVILAKSNLNRGRVCDLMDAPYPGAPEKELATFFCYCSSRIWKTDWFLVDIVGFWILLLFSLSTSEGEKEKQHFLFLWCIAHAFSVPDFFFPCPFICLTFLCDLHIMRVCFPRVKLPLVPSWKGGCFLWSCLLVHGFTDS